MNKKKKVGISILMLMLILTITNVPKGHSESNLWGIPENSSINYKYTVSYEGNISNSLNERDYAFTIYNIWDNDGNNYTELLYFRQRMIGGLPEIEPNILDDVGWNWQDFLSPLKGEEIYPFLPISCNDTLNIGLNWSTELYIINTTFVNYSVATFSNRVEISHWSSGVDIDTGAPYTTDELIVWDYIGWLISYELTIDYNEPLNYILKASIEQNQNGLGLIIDVPLLIGIIGIILGTTGIILGVYILNRFKKYADEEFPSQEEPSTPVPFTDSDLNHQETV